MRRPRKKHELASTENIFPPEILSSWVRQVLIVEVVESLGLEKKNYFSSFEICLVSLQDSLFASGLGLSCPSHPPVNSGCCWIKSCYKMCKTFNQIQRNQNLKKARKFSGLRNAGFSPPYRSLVCLCFGQESGWSSLALCLCLCYCLSPSDRATRLCLCLSSPDRSACVWIKDGPALSCRTPLLSPPVQWVPANF